MDSSRSYIYLLDPVLGQEDLGFLTQDGGWTTGSSTQNTARHTSLIGLVNFHLFYRVPDRSFYDSDLGLVERGTRGTCLQTGRRETSGRVWLTGRDSDPGSGTPPRCLWGVSVLVRVSRDGTSPLGATMRWEGRGGGLEWGRLDKVLWGHLRIKSLTPPFINELVRVWLKNFTSPLPLLD